MLLLRQIIKSYAFEHVSGEIVDDAVRRVKTSGVNIPIIGQLDHCAVREVQCIELILACAV